MEWGPGERPVFTVGARTVSWDDVLRRAERTGELDAVRRETAAGLAALERDGPPAPDGVRAAAAAFRYARHLLAADELEAWLGDWGLTTDEWLAHLRRRIAGESDRASPGGAVSDERAVLVDAVCSGALERWAAAYAERLAVAPDGTADDELEARFEAFRHDAVTAEAVAREIESRRLDWMRVEGELVAVADVDVALEIALCAREDGDPLDELAARAGATLVRLDALLDDVEPALSAALLGAREGEILGPLADEARWLVGRVSRKAAPSPDDPEARQRAAEVVVRRAVEREVERRVRPLRRPEGTRGADRS